MSIAPLPEPIEVPRAEDRPTVPVREASPWFGVSAATFYRAAAEGRAPCSVLHVGSRVVVVVASARRALGLDVTAPERDETPAATPALVRDHRGGTRDDARAS